MHRLAAFLLIALAGTPATACSLGGSKQFLLDQHEALPLGSLPATTLRDAELFFFPEGSGCAGLGMLTLTVRLAPSGTQRVGDIGYVIRPVAGVNDREQFPPYPFAVMHNPYADLGRNEAMVMMGMAGATPDADGHVRWRLALVPVDKQGREGEPIPFCVATDDFCSTPASRAPVVPAPRPTPRDPSACLPEEAVDPARLRAEHGSLRDAKALRRHYADCVGDEVHAHGWLYRSGMDLGDPDARRELIDLWVHSDKDWQRRDARAYAKEWKLEAWFAERYPDEKAE
jgi:hypothetical protein